VTSTSNTGKLLWLVTVAWRVMNESTGQSMLVSKKLVLLAFALDFFERTSPQRRMPKSTKPNPSGPATVTPIFVDAFCKSETEPDSALVTADATVPCLHIRAYATDNKFASTEQGGDADCFC